MIRYPVTRQELEDAVDAVSSDWRDRAAARTQRLVALQRWTDEFQDDEERVTWSEVKKVFRDLQHEKCAYCERRLDSDPDLPTLGSQEHDLEHFRPKSKTIPWKKRALFPEQHVDFRKGMGRKQGYFWLAFELWNWCTSCKRCNSQLKGNRFPLSKSGTSGSPTDSVPDLQETERPLLVYPLGELDRDPEQLLEFHGLTVRPRAPAGGDRHRGRAVIAFFLLNAGGLVQSRAVWLTLTWNHLVKDLDGDSAGREKVDSWLASTKVPHAAAVRAFIRLGRGDRARAEAVMVEVGRIMEGFE